MNQWLQVLFCFIAFSSISVECSYAEYIDGSKQIIESHIGKNCSLELIVTPHAISPAFFQIHSKTLGAYFLKFSNVGYEECNKLKALTSYISNSPFKNELKQIVVLHHTFGNYNHDTDWIIFPLCKGQELAIFLNRFYRNPTNDSLTMFSRLGQTIGRLHKIGNFRCEDGKFISNLVHKDLHPHNIFYDNKDIQLIDNSNFFLTNNVVEDISYVLLQSTPFPQMMYCYAVDILNSEGVLDKEIPDNKLIQSQKIYTFATAFFLNSYIKTIELDRKLQITFIRQLYSMIFQNYGDLYIKDNELREKIIPAFYKISNLDLIDCNYTKKVIKRALTAVYKILTRYICD